jgi:hypothetical protein
MPISDQHVVNVCKYATDKQCKYLDTDELSSSKFNCLKLTSQKELIDKIMNGDVKNISHNAQAMKDNDNCKGYPNFKHKIFGYDQKST